MKKVLTFLACIAVPLGLGALGGVVTSSNINSWYVTLNQPSFRPPNWLFGPVWTVLYILMGVSFFMILQATASSNKKRAIRVAVIQMLLNSIWSFLFFYFHQLAVALVDIIVLWIFILTMIITYYPLNKTASLLQIPYLAWVSFATILNAAFVYLN